MTVTAENVFNLPMESNDAGAATVREYFLLIAAAVWKHNEGFNGKKPFGNSGWYYEVADTLMQAGVAEANVDKLIAEAFILESKK